MTQISVPLSNRYQETTVTREMLSKLAFLYSLFYDKSTTDLINYQLYKTVSLHIMQDLLAPLNLRTYFLVISLYGAHYQYKSVHPGIINLLIVLLCELDKRTDIFF